MSWAVEEWKDGLPGKALQKIQEMEVQLDKLKKERTQKQFQLDSLEAALQKQKQKVSVHEEWIHGLLEQNRICWGNYWCIDHTIMGVLQDTKLEVCLIIIYACLSLGGQ